MSTPFGVIDNTLASPQGYPPVHEAYGYNGEILGQGAYGVVLMATHKVSGAKHALKFVDKSCNDLEKEIEMLTGSGSMTFASSQGLVATHENLLECYGVYTSNTKLVFATGLADFDLGTWLERRSPLSSQIASCATRQIGSGLLFLHDKGFLHRNLKPRNILVFVEAVDRVTLKLCDFGLSRTINVAMQTLWYRAPEFFFDRVDYTTSADVWSFGLIVYECVTGQQYG